MKLLSASFLVALVAIVALAGCSSETTSSSSTSKFSCSINGDCRKCPNADEQAKCATSKPHTCETAETSFCSQD